MANGVHKITEDFERALCDYTGSQYAIALDNMSNALFLALYYEHHVKNSITNNILVIVNDFFSSGVSKKLILSIVKLVKN